MVAKTWWRLIHSEDLLAHRVLKAKYCGTTPLRDAWGVNKCSLLWKSLLFGKELVDAGSYWRIGTGERVDVWRDRWVPNATGYKVRWRTREMPFFRSISSLIDGTTRQWRVDVLTAIMRPEDVDNVLATPLSYYGSSDRLIWQPVPNEKFSVRSAYTLARQLAGEEVGSYQNREPMWKQIWKTQVPPKVQQFAWRAVRNFCPTAVNLRRRGMDGVLGCPVCSEVEEDMFHILFDCVLSKDVWSLVCPSALVVSGRLHGAERFWQQWIEAVAKEAKLEVSLMVCWLLWKNRNQCFHEQKCATSLALSASVHRYLKAYIEAVIPHPNKESPARVVVEW